MGGGDWLGQAAGTISDVQWGNVPNYTRTSLPAFTGHAGLSNDVRKQKLRCLKCQQLASMSQQQQQDGTPMQQISQKESVQLPTPLRR